MQKQHVSVVKKVLNNFLEKFIYFMLEKQKDLKIIPKNFLAHILCTQNNTHVTITDSKGNTISWASGGTTGAKGSRRSTAFSGQRAAFNAAKNAKNLGVENVNVILEGFGRGRASAPRGLLAGGLNILSIKNRVKEPHNGCRSKKQKRKLYKIKFYIYNF